MEVKIQEVFVEVPTRWGKVKKQHGLSRVLVGGELAGYVPTQDESEEHCTSFHPLDGFPREMDAAVIAASGGKLTKSTRDRKAKNEPAMEQTSKPKA